MCHRSFAPPLPPVVVVQAGNPQRSSFRSLHDNRRLLILSGFIFSFVCFVMMARIGLPVACDPVLSTCIVVTGIFTN